MTKDLKPCRFEGDFCAEHQSRERLVRADFCEEVYFNKRHLWESRRPAPDPVAELREAERRVVAAAVRRHALLKTLVAHPHDGRAHQGAESADEILADAVVALSRLPAPDAPKEEKK